MVYNRNNSPSRGLSPSGYASVFIPWFTSLGIVLFLSCHKCIINISLYLYHGLHHWELFSFHLVINVQYYTIVSAIFDDNDFDDDEDEDENGDDEDNEDDDNDHSIC